MEETVARELVAALAGGGALTFEPDVEEEVLLPVLHVPSHPRDAEPETAPRGGESHRAH